MRALDASRKPGRGHRRGGFSLLELSTAAFVVIAAMTMTIFAVGSSATNRRRVERRQVALREAANVMERISIRSWDELKTGPLPLSESARKSLPKGALNLLVSDSPPAMKRVRVEVLWQDQAGLESRPETVRLSSWLARRDGGRP